MLYLVGLGLGDAEDITLKGLKCIQASAKVYLESYTSILSVGTEVLVGDYDYTPVKVLYEISFLILFQYTIVVSAIVEALKLPSVSVTVDTILIPLEIS